MSDAPAVQKPFKMLSYVARQFLGLTEAEWKGLSEDDQKKYAKSANRALKAAEKFKERLAATSA